MLRIEVISNKSTVISSKDYAQTKIHLGRHASNDVIIPDPRISRFECSFERQSDGTYLFKSKGQNRHFSSDFELILHDFKIRVHNLGLISDEITQEVAIDLHQEQSKATIYKWALALFLILCIDNFIFEARNEDWIRTLTEFAAAYLVAGALAIVFSFLSRAIEGKYNFFPLLSLFLKITTILGLISQNVFGLRWLLGSWLWYDPIYYLSYLALILYFVWQIGLLTFSHVKPWIRIAVVVICGFSILTPQAIKFLPFRENYQYLIKHAAPPLLPVFESSPKTVDDVLKAIHDL